MDYQAVIERIKEKLPKTKEYILADNHLEWDWVYEFPLPAREEEIVKTEERLKIAIPAALRAYYGGIANGGPGPGYGMYPLDKLWVIEGYELSQDPLPQCKTLMKRLSRKEGNSYQALCFLTQGDAYDVSCLLEGPDQGKIVMSCDEEPYLMAADENFLDWYERWIDEMLAGFDMNLYPDRYKGSQEELIRLFKDNQSDEKVQQQILLSLNRYPNLLPDTFTFYLSLLFDSRFADKTGYYLFVRGIPQGRQHIVSMLISSDKEKKDRAMTYLIWAAQHGWGLREWLMLLNEPEIKEDETLSKEILLKLKDWYAQHVKTLQFIMSQAKRIDPSTEEQLEQSKQLALKFKEYLAK
ncbi:MAG: hypothetical protein LBR25_01940 [Erysipelotrichaceae bacterium]|jgi:hypothetical protein|nr:hypothetical protein [Erysipelotrichaceae bacterium]